MSHLHTLLFKGDATHPPLFDSQAHLARAICTARGEGPDKHTSTASFLSQILSGHRRLPKSWEAPLAQVVQARMEAQGRPTQTTQQILSQLAPPNKRGPLADLIDSQRHARDVLILNEMPIELTNTHESHPEAELLSSMMEKSLRFGTTYHYCVGSNENARRLWEALKLRFSEDEQEFERWIETGRLRVSVVPGLLLLNPTVAFNMGAPSRLQVFIWHAPYDWEHCLAIPEKQLGLWFHRVQTTR